MDRRRGRRPPGGVDDNRIHRDDPAGDGVGARHGVADGRHAGLVGRHVLEHRRQRAQRGDLDRPPGASGDDRLRQSRQRCLLVDVRGPRPTSATSPADPATLRRRSSELLLERAVGWNSGDAGNGRAGVRPLDAVEMAEQALVVFLLLHLRAWRMRFCWSMASFHAAAQAYAASRNWLATPLTSTRSTPMRSTNDVAWVPFQSTSASVAAPRRPVITDSSTSRAPTGGGP